MDEDIFPNASLTVIFRGLRTRSEPQAYVFAAVPGLSLDCGADSGRRRGDPAVQARAPICAGPPRRESRDSASQVSWNGTW